MVSKRLRLGVLVAATGLLLLGPSVAPDAEARTRCSYAGPPVNTLTVTITGFSSGEIFRFGEQILVAEFLQRPRHCAGGDPTVLNTDSIKVRTRGAGATVDLLLEGGPFAPGVTPETDGAPEIEVAVSGGGLFGTIVGTSRVDELHWGPGDAVNLNPRDSGDQDADATVRGMLFLVVEGASGNDTIVPAPGAVVPDGAFSQGGRGNDLLIAPEGGGSILEGGDGNDTVTGGGSGDSLDGGRGRDLLSGGRGRDHIGVRDSRRDLVRCGAGRDRVRADRRDRLRGCELVSRR
jgi:hypothetical protein